MIKDIAFTAYPAKDVTALRRFYTENLGIAFGEPMSRDGVEKYAEAQVGSGWFVVITDEWADIAPVSGIGFEVDNLEETLSHLRSRGVATEEIFDTPVCRMASFTDPAGNKVTLHQTTVAH